MKTVKALPPKQSPVRGISRGEKRQASLAGFFGKVESPLKRSRAVDSPPDVSEPVKVSPAGPSNGFMELESGPSRLPSRAGEANSHADNFFFSKPSAAEIHPDDEDDIEFVDPFADYPPANHPSYHLPPRPNYNHPIAILPPPPSLVSALKFNTSPRNITSPADLDLLYFTRFIQPSCSRRLMRYLLDVMPWYRVNYTTKGIDIKTPRYTTVFGKDATAMPWEAYSRWEPRAIPEILLRLMQKVEEVTGQTYNFALINYYASGGDSISYHSDSERFLGPNPCIASISLGAPRDFLLRHANYKKNQLPVQKFSLADGDMVVMRGTTQHKWEHSIPKRAHAEGRINITFRKGIVQYATENYLTYNVGRGPMFRWEGGRMVEKG